MDSLLEVKDLSTRFVIREGIVRAVSGVSFDIRAGETIALVGESGCGKSVTALSILRLVHPGEIVGGQVIFNGQDLLKLTDEEIRLVRGGDIAMIFQEPMTSLNPTLTIGAQIAEALETHLNMHGDAARQRSIDLLHMVGISDAKSRLDSFPFQFSGGMRQRVMIAMAISCNPKLLIADEPTTAVDVTIQAQILEIMREMTENFGTALIIITHNLGIVARYARRVNVMYAGHIVEKGASSDIYDTPHHPYTIGLMNSVPRLDEPRKAKLNPIEGLPPDLLNLPAGCPFYHRCTFAIDKCTKDIPPLVPISNGHYVACWVDIRERENVRQQHSARS